MKTKTKTRFPRAPRAFLPTMTSTPPTPPLPSMDDLEEPEQLTGFMQSATQADVVTDANDFDEVPIRNRFTGRIVEGKKQHNRPGRVLAVVLIVLKPIVFTDKGVEPSSSKPDSSQDTEEENVCSQKSSKSGEQSHYSQSLQSSTLIMKSVVLSKFQ